MRQVCGVVTSGAEFRELLLANKEQVRDAVTSLDVTWISNEHPAVFPEIAARAPISPPKDQFLLAVDGVPVASTGPHGQSIQWFDQ